jgi:hypothetical protein
LPLETGTYISDLNTSNPAASDGLSQADDHLRLIKSTVKASFPNVTGAVTAPQAALNSAGHAAGQCQLSLSGASLLLSTWRGNRLMINSLAQTVPDAGVLLAPTSLATLTSYYIYAYMNGSTMTLEASTTPPASQTGTGIITKNGDVTRTLVGMARTDATPVWSNSSQSGILRSWFNDRGTGLTGAFLSNHVISNAAYAVINGEITSEFLVWAGETIRVTACGKVGSDTIGATVETSITFDGTTVAEDAYSFYQGPSPIAPGAFALSLVRRSLSEGYHTVSLIGKTSSGNATYYGAAGTSRSVLNVFLRV